VEISKWFLKNLGVLRGLYRAWYVLWQGAIAAVALTWITLVGLVLCKLPPLSTLPKIIPVYLVIGLGLVLLVMSVVGLVIVLAVLIDNWWKWTKRSIFKKVRTMTWDLEYNVQMRKEKTEEIERKNREKLTELKNAAWEV
jgi:hypothetical protein